MFNKLLLQNNDAPFNVTFVWTDHLIPTGKFEAEETLGNFILGVARKWWKNVEKVSAPEAPKVVAIKEIDFIAPVVEDTIVETPTITEPIVTSAVKKAKKVK